MKQKSKISFLVVADYLYYWSNDEGSIEGKQITIEDEEDEIALKTMKNLVFMKSGNDDDLEYESDGVFEKIKLRCRKWQVDEKVSAVPTVFDDLSEQFAIYVDELGDYQKVLR